MKLFRVSPASVPVLISALPGSTVWLVTLMMAAACTAAEVNADNAPSPAQSPSPVERNSASSVSFNRDIRPLLAANCFSCHGPDASARQGELRLDEQVDALRDREGLRAIVPGNSSASDVWKRITTDDPDLRMPPPDSGHSLDAQQADQIRLWIDSGAVYEQHWSFEPLTRPSPPDVQQTERVRNAIDRFILARLDHEGLAPSDEADRHTLIRRVSLDLTGLPPTPAEVDRFVNDHSPQAYETLVDRLLDSPRYGEHWARMWLDLARYADTKGYEKDQPRNIWRYRDWVIQAFNADLPFDEFTIQQIAGDLLPGATSDQTLATAFHRNTMTNDEGGTDNEEFRIAAVKDRVDTTIQVWMGLTMGCAKCHSHKYDPISQQEYYSFYDYFNQTEDADRPDDAPRLPTPTLAQQHTREELNSQLVELRRELEKVTPEFTAARTRWEQEIAGDTLWHPLTLESAESAGGAKLTLQPDHSILASGDSPERDTYTVTMRIPPSPTSSDRAATAIRLEALTHESLANKGPGRNGADPNFVVSEFTVHLSRSTDPQQIVTLTDARADFSQKNWPVSAAIDGNPATGWAISPQAGRSHVAVFSISKPQNIADADRLVISLSQQYGNRLVLGRFRLSVSFHSPATLAPELQSVNELAAVPAEQRSAADQRRLDDAFRRVYPPTAQQLPKVAAIEQQLTELDAAIVRTPVMRELSDKQRRTTHIHVRGNFLQPGDAVSSGVPTAFGTLPDDAPANRLGVAQWLVAPANPLTARVTVNRFWARFFGTGLVETEEDFGMQGTPPAHPELLDWLATEFRDTHRWSMKQLSRTIVLSGTYRQSSRINPATRSIDPANRLLSRAPRFRLTAETVRDQALAASGLLSSRIGGPSVMPPQPPGIWQATYSQIKWETSAGDDRYRRGLYTFWRRTSPYPSMLAFDAGSREVCVIRRIRTNTPLQALVTLNDPVFVEAAGALAQQTVNTVPVAENRPRAAFERVLCRPPTNAEEERLVALLTAAQHDYTHDSAAATALIRSAGLIASDVESPATLAAWILIGNVLLNLDETLTRP